MHIHAYTYVYMHTRTHAHTHTHMHTVHSSICILIFISGQIALKHSDILSTYIIVFGINKHTYRFISTDYNQVHIIEKTVSNFHMPYQK